MSEKKIIVTGAVIRCPDCLQSGTTFEPLTLDPELCARCEGAGRIVRLETCEKGIYLSVEEPVS